MQRRPKWAANFSCRPGTPFFPLGEWMPSTFLGVIFLAVFVLCKRIDKKRSGKGESTKRRAGQKGRASWVDVFFFFLSRADGASREATRNEPLVKGHL